MTKETLLYRLGEIAAAMPKPLTQMERRELELVRFYRDRIRLLIADLEAENG